jgi:Zn-dependent protease with chaperone function
VSTGLFLGTWAHNASPLARDWTQRVVDCRQEADAAHPDDWQARFPVERRCLAGVELRRFAFALGGAAVALSAGLAVMLVAPTVIERRRRLRRTDARMTPVVDRFRELTRDAGLAREPQLMVGSATLRDAFSYGFPARYRVAVPPAILVRWRDRSTFEPVIRHELAHIRHHDVPLAWLARSMWLVVLPLLAIPIVGSFLRNDFSLLGSYLWRAVLLAAVSLVAAAALLRSREFDADSRASSDPIRLGDLKNVLARIAAPSHSRWRRLLTYHPAAADRLDTLQRPQNQASVTFFDGLTPAFLVGLTLPLLENVISTVTPRMTSVLVAVVVGPLLGAALGLGLWRQSLVRRVVGGACSAVLATLGVLVGSALGAIASLGHTGTGTVGGYEHITSNLVLPIALCGATLITAGVGEVFAEASSRSRRPELAWATCILVSGTIFAEALVAGRTLALVLDQSGWELASLVLLGNLGGREPAIVALALAVVTAGMLLAARRQAGVPAWAVWGDESPPPKQPTKPGLLGVVIVGFAAGVVACLVITGNRLVAGPAQTESEIAARVDLVTWIIATAGLAATLALAALQPGRGLGVALIASPVASMVTAMGYLGLNTALGGYLSFEFVEAIARPGVSLGLIGTVAGGALALLLQRRRPEVRNGTALAIVAALLAGLMSLSVVAGRAVIIPALLPSSPNPDAVPGELYVDLVARPLLQSRATQAEAWKKLRAEQPSNAVAARRVRGEILPLVQQLRDRANAVKLDDPQVEEVHARAIAGAKLHVAAFTQLAEAFDREDRELFDDANALLQQGDAQWAAWATGVQSL